MAKNIKRFNKKNSKKQKEKKALYLQRELFQINEQIRELGYVKLDKPYKKGYKKSFRLKAEYTSLPESGELIEALSYINDIRYCPIKDFKKYTYYSSLCYEPVLHKISVYKYNLLPEEIKKHFVKTAFTSLSGKDIFFYKIAHPEYFETFTIKHIVNEVKVIDPDLEKRKTELENYIKKNNLWPLINKLRGHPTSGKKRRMYNNANKKTETEKIKQKDLDMYYNFFEG